MSGHNKDFGDSQALIKWLASQCHSETGFGSLSPSIYDTAWVSMIKSPDKPNEWLFPKCFRYILDTQLHDGTWPAYASVADGILNTAAALLAVQKHLSTGHESVDLLDVSHKAADALKKMLLHLDISKCDQVGFELLLTSLMSLLAEEGVSLKLPSLEKLHARRIAKLAKLPASSVYGAPSTLYHSLEGLIGHIDFDRISQWRQPNGSMMGSPSSTAAYLMHASIWDHQAELYLRDVVLKGSGQGSGGVPSAWPTSIFEITWSITTLVESGIHIGEPENTLLGDFLETSLQAHGGLVGFESWALPDADDTAKSAMALYYLGRRTDDCIKSLVDTFEAPEHFRTYLAEMNPSISANINVLSCLLLLDEPLPYISQIVKASSFVYTQVFVGQVREKWHINDLYWMMLLAKSMALLYRQTQQNPLFCEELFSLAPQLRQQIPAASLELHRKVRGLQQSSGEWEGGCEVTAYAVLILSTLAGLPWIGSHEGITESAIRGQRYLQEHKSEWKRGAYMWTEKVTYSSSVLSETYCLAAALVPVVPLSMDAFPHPFQIDDSMIRAMRKAGALIRRTPLFARVDSQLLAMAELEACYALKELQRQRLDIFPRKGLGKDKYLTFIPLIWIACTSLQTSSVSASILREMMVLSMLNYQVDEYMEVIVGSRVNFPAARGVVKALFTESRAQSERKTDAADLNGPDRLGESHESNRSDVSGTKNVLGHYVSHILGCPAVIDSHRHLQLRLKRELQTFLMAHIDHAEDNQRFLVQLSQISHEPNQHYDGVIEALPAHEWTKADVESSTSQTSAVQIPRYEDPGRSFYEWVRSTSADHTSCPFSFVFFYCLIAQSQSDVLRQDARIAYLLEAACRHLASLCRMYNDCGSLARDRAEMNLNSVNFPEFMSQAGDEEATKAALMDIAEYERRGLDTALSELERVLQEFSSAGDAIAWMSALKLFVNVTDLFGQIYVVKDIATQIRK